MAVIGGAASCGTFIMRATLQVFRTHVTVCRNTKLHTDNADTTDDH